MWIQSPLTCLGMVSMTSETGELDPKAAIGLTVRLGQAVCSWLPLLPHRPASFWGCSDG